MKIRTSDNGTVVSIKTIEESLEIKIVSNHNAVCETSIKVYNAGNDRNFLIALSDAFKQLAFESKQNENSIRSR